MASKNRIDVLLMRKFFLLLIKKLRCYVWIIINYFEVYKFMDIYHDTCSRFIPLAKNESRRHQWTDRELRRAIREKKHIWHKLTASGGNKDLVIKYKAAKKAVKILLKNSMLSYEKLLASNAKSNPKAIFKYINSKKTIKQSIRALWLPDSSGTTTTNPDEIANLLDAHFNSVFTVDNNDEAPNFPIRTDSTGTIEDIDCSPEAIKSRLLKLKIGKACGPDNTHTSVLKHRASTLCIPASILFRKSLSKCSVPSTWKKANITLIFKKGSRLAASNYRPVSLTLIVSKVLEGCIKDTLMNHLQSNKLISTHQHGFFCKKSCTTNLLESLDYITMNIEMKIGLLIIYLDFSKASDKVCHRLLAHKLRSYGICPRIVAWIIFFLANRKQRVILENNLSDWADVLSGIPQGTVLGPNLFII
jgi:hypothetical protein